MLLQAVFNTTNTLATTDVQDLMLLVFKIMFIVAAFLYVLFSVVVVRQISIMRSTLVTEYSAVLQTLGYAHLLVAIGVLLFFIISL